MATIQLEIPDELAQQADAAGLLAPRVIEELLRQQLQQAAAQRLRSLLDQMPKDALSAEVEQDIVETIRAVRAGQQG